MHLRYTTPVIISGAAFFGALSLLAFYPGLVTYDSIVQYEQSLSGHYIFYPPAMALTWGALNELHPGPILMTSLNLLLYWSCFAVLAVYCVAAAGRWSGALSLTAGLFPFLLSFSGVVWTDVLLASSWGLSCSILLMIARSDGRSWAARFGWCTAATLLVFGDAMRHIAAPAAIVLASALALHANLRTVASRVAVFVALAIPLAVAVPVSDYLVDAGDGWGIEKLMSWDLTGISYFSGQNYRAGGIRPDPIDNLECYSPRLFDGCELVPFVNRAEATARWGAAVAEQPLSYLKHRALIFSMLLRAGCDRCSPYSWVDHSDPNPYGFEFKSNSMHRLLGKAQKILVRSPLGRPYVWLVAAVGLTAMMWHRREITLALISASGVVYTLSYALVAPSDEFRYLYWLFFSVVIVITAVVFGSTNRFRFRALAMWVVIPVLLAGVTERLLRYQWPTDDIAPSMATNY